MYEEENKLKLKFVCPNNHEFNEEYDSLYKKSKIDFDNIECKKCNNKKLKNKFYICFVCKNFYCKKCKNEHKKENNIRFENKVGSMDLVGGESLIKERILERLQSFVVVKKFERLS